VVASPDQTILRPGEREWLSRTLGLDMSRPSPCFVRKRAAGDELTAANFIKVCHANEDQDAAGAGYVMVTVTELETGRKIATTTSMADHDSIFSSMYELTSEQISPAVVDLKRRSNSNVKCDGASAAVVAAAAANAAASASVLLGSSDDEVNVIAQAAPSPPASGLPLPTVPCYAGFRADGSMGLAFGGQAAKAYSRQKSIAAFHVDKIFDRASCNGWGDAFAFGDPSTANFAAQRRRELLCGQTEDIPILNFEAYILRADTATAAAASSDVSAADWRWLGAAFGGANMVSRRACYSYDLMNGDVPSESTPGNQFGKDCGASHMADDEMLVVSAVLSTGKHIFGRVFSKKWLDGNYTDPISFGVTATVTPPVVDPGAMLVELTGKRVYRNIFTERPVLRVEHDGGFSFQGAISFLPHKRIAYVVGLGVDSFVAEEDMVGRCRLTASKAEIKEHQNLS